MRRSVVFALAFLAAAFAFRLFYGLSMPFWYEDERQVYLIGLDSFTSGEWPFYGYIVWPGGRVPGALLGWLIRAPLAVLQIPEAPAILLNLLSLAALAFFAWYLSRRFALVPRWLIWSSLVVLPWTLNFSTHIVNPSYVLAGAILFFVGFFEATPPLSRGVLKPWLAWALMGFGFFWIMQLHMSWVLLPIYVVAALVLTLRAGSQNGAPGLQTGGASPGLKTRGSVVLVAITGFAAGALLPASLLVPTFLRDGLAASGIGGVVEYQPQHPWGLVSTTARILSFASFETNRFFGLSTTERALVFWREPWLLLFGAIVTLAGWLHPLWMTVSAFRRSSDPAAVGEWRAVRWLLAGSVLLVWASFFGSMRFPQAHAFYLMLPVAVLFAFTVWQVRAQARGSRLPGMERIAGGVLISSVILHAGLAIDRGPRLSLSTDRDVMVAAIANHEDRYLGERLGRQQVITETPMADLEIVRADWMPVLDRFSSFDATITNHSRSSAWIDLRYATTYLSEHGQLLTVRSGVIKRMIQPGQTRTFTGIPDGGVPPGARRATMTMIGAERVVPVPAARPR